jgi:ParB family chromosome partitioning protein
MMKRTAGLGRGLGALIPPKPGRLHPSGGRRSARPAFGGTGGEDEREKKGDARASEPPSLNGVYREIAVSSIASNPQQPRSHFDHAALEDLVSSIRERGIVQPLIVTERADGAYELVAGERRLRAARIAGLAAVPCIVRTASEQDKLELALIENVQRHDLNPIEEARAYKRLIEEFGMTQDEVGRRVGKSRPQVANAVRLLQLPEEIRQALMNGKISASNARTLLSLPSDKERKDLFRAMLAGQFTVRETEARVPHPRRPRQYDPNLLEHERRLREALGHRVTVRRNAKGEGEIRIHFHSDEELRNVVSKITRNSK